MAADALAPCVARTSAAMILSVQLSYQNVFKVGKAPKKVFVLGYYNRRPFVPYFIVNQFTEA